ncbi:MAG: hypothetical protein M3Z02_00245 [Actinomycetota bacterium]|nr:hypothetical protein [Actinomycetota bacterium]
MGWFSRAGSLGRHRAGAGQAGLSPATPSLSRQRWLPPAEPAESSEPAVPTSSPPPVAVRLAFRDGSAIALGPDEPLSQALTALADQLANRPHKT